jgi:hypothetical protein
MDDLHKVPDDALIKDLKKQLSQATQLLSANEQYILELKDEIHQLKHTLMNSTKEDKLMIKTERRVLLLTTANIKFRKEIKDLRILNNRYLVKMLDNEKNNNANNTK